MTDYTISGKALQPDGVTGLAGTWTIDIPSSNGVAFRGTSDFSAHVQTYDTARDGSLSVTLPETTGDELYTASFVSLDRLVKLGPFPFALTADTTWQDIIETPTTPPLTPSMVSQTLAARDAAEGYRDEAQAFRDEQETIAGLTGEDDAVAFLMGSESETADAVSALVAGGLPLADVRRALAGATLWDDFQRSDRELYGDQAPSGHVYVAENPDTCFITGGVYTPQMVSGQVSILYYDMDGELTSVFCLFRWNTALQSQNPVLGSCKVGYGSGSVQLAVWPTTTEADDWRIFYFNDNTDTTIAHGNWAAGFTPEVGRWYGLMMERTGPTSVKAYLPDGTRHEVTDALIADYWGNRGGAQMRRALVDTADLSFGFLSAVSTPAPTQPVPGSSLVFDGTSFGTGAGTAGDRAATIMPARTSDDLDVTVMFVPDAQKPDNSVDLVSHWSADLGRSFSAMLRSNGSPQLRCSLGGVTVDTFHGNPVTPDADWCGFRMTRTAADGAVTLYVTTDPAADSKPVTDPAWTSYFTGTTTAGALDSSTAPLQIAAADSTAFNYAGAIQSVVLRDGVDGPEIANPQPGNGRWTGYDAAGNRWHVSGANWGWGASTTAQETAKIVSAGTGTGSVQIGVRSTSDDSHSVALGDFADTTASNQVNIGDRHLEAKTVSAALGAPGAGAGRAWFADDGTGKVELLTRFPSGSAVVLAKEGGRGASAALNFGSIAAGASAELTISGVPNAVIGDAVAYGTNGGMESGLVPYVYVSATGVVTVRLTNVTGAAIDPAARTWKVQALK